MTTETGESVKHPLFGIHFLLRVAAIVIAVEGIVGLLFFILAGIYQLTGESFPVSPADGGADRNLYSFYIILHIILFTGLLVSGILLLKARKTGLYLFIISYIILAILNYYFNDVFSWTMVVTGFVLLVVLIFFSKKLV